MVVQKVEYSLRQWSLRKSSKNKRRKIITEYITITIATLLNLNLLKKSTKDKTGRRKEQFSMLKKSLSILWNFNQKQKNLFTNEMFQILVLFPPNGSLAGVTERSINLVHTHKFLRVQHQFFYKRRFKYHPSQQVQFQFSPSLSVGMQSPMVFHRKRPL